MKTRKITWEQFSKFVACWKPDYVCPMYFECAAKWPLGTKRNARNCRAWRQMPAVEDDEAPATRKGDVK